MSAGDAPGALAGRAPHLAYLLRQARARPREIARGVARLTSPEALYLDPHHDLARASLVVASGRSGTTLLAEAMVAGNGLRLVFEPLRADRVRASRGIPRGLWLAPGAVDRRLEAVCDASLTGRLRSLWADSHNPTRLARGRVVKEVRATNLVAWLEARYPEVPVVYLLRHPLAVAVSALDLGWRDELDVLLGPAGVLEGPLAAERDLAERTAAAHRGDVVAFALRWCLENVATLRRLTALRAHVVVYEDLVREPARELARLAAYLAGRQPGLWADWRPTPALLERPSRSSWRTGVHPAPTHAHVASWTRRIDREDLRAAVDVLDEFGVTPLYRDTPIPQGDPADLAR